MKKPRKRTDFKDNLGKYLLDISKLIFGAIFLSSILRIGLSEDILLTGGFLFALIIGLSGLRLVTKEKKEGKDE